MSAPRIDHHQAFPEALRAMQGLERAVHAAGLEPALLELVKIRASQINGCAYCLDMHTKDARIAGETEQRIYALSAWRETPFFTARERAALEWTETLTCIAECDVDDDLYAHVRELFDERELCALTLAVVAINGWNRFAIAFRAEPGSYTPAARQTTA